MVITPGGDAKHDVSRCIGPAEGVVEEGGAREPEVREDRLLDAA
jgi:hypothetical protein